MESLAWELFWKLFDAYPDCRLDIGDSWDLALDNMYASGSCGAPDDHYPVHLAYVRLWVERKWGPLWIFFEEEGVALCKSLHDHPEVLFAKKRSIEIPYADPRLFTFLERVLAYFGWPVTFPRIDLAQRGSIRIPHNAEQPTSSSSRTAGCSAGERTEL
jgi:hypothetical protein